MLQIIGWLGCFYLAFRSAQMIFSREFRNDDGSAVDGAGPMMLVGIVVAMGFAIWLAAQGSAVSDTPIPDFSQYNEPMEPSTLSEFEQCLEAGGTASTC